MTATKTPTLSEWTAEHVTMTRQRIGRRPDDAMGDWPGSFHFILTLIPEAVAVRGHWTEAIIEELPL